MILAILLIAIGTLLFSIIAYSALYNSLVSMEKNLTKLIDSNTTEALDLLFNMERIKAEAELTDE